MALGHFSPELVSFFVSRTRFIQNLTTRVIEQCEKIAKVSEISANTRDFLGALAAYLTKRRAQIGDADDIHQIETRSNFIEKIVQQIGNGQIPDLSEEIIKPFKGFFSQELYNICRSYRDLINKTVQLSKFNL